MVRDERERQKMDIKEDITGLERIKCGEGEGKRREVGDELFEGPQTSVQGYKCNMSPCGSRHQCTRTD